MTYLQRFSSLFVWKSHLTRFWRHSRPLIIPNDLLTWHECSRQCHFVSDVFAFVQMKWFGSTQNHSWIPVFYTSILWSIDIIIAILIVNYMDKLRKSELFRSWHSSIQGHSSARGGAILQRGEITKVLASKQKFKSSGSGSAQFSFFFKFKQ